MSPRLTQISKYLSKHLRHTPESIGLTLEDGGWVSIDALITGAARNRFVFSREELLQAVAGNPKQRFSIDHARDKIKANQGHSAKVQLCFDSRTPPADLFHGTASKNTESILRTGLQRMRRHHVHLSADVTTAIAVGRRHGDPVVFRVDSERMTQDGWSFFVSENGVWLVDAVPAQYLRLLDPSEFTR